MKAEQKKCKRCEADKAWEKADKSWVKARDKALDKAYKASDKAWDKALEKANKAWDKAREAWSKVDKLKHSDGCLKKALQMMEEKKKCEDADIKAWHNLGSLMREKIIKEALADLKAKALKIVDEAMKVNQKLKEAYIAHGQPTEKADYEIAVWTEIRRRFDEAL